MYVVLSKLILPKISANLEIRKLQIVENIEAAEKQREQSELNIVEYEKIVQNSKNEAKNYFKQSREGLLKDINLKKDALDKELNKEIQKWSEKVRRLGGIPLSLYQVKIPADNGSFFWEFPSADIEFQA